MKDLEEQNHKKRIRSLAILIAIVSVILGTSTYAWFIGMRTVHVSPFEVEIAATESLMLSLNGEDWYDTVSINADNYNDPDVVYADHTNWWAGKGLIPMSSMGIISSEAKLTLFEKASLTATPGGYRLMASRVNNHAEDTSGTTPDGIVPEKDGYVAFDLFIKNSSGSQYLSAYNILDEEAIYLTYDSKATVALGGVEDTGIENSVRVAFAQIGRVVGTEDDPDVITSITCAGTGGSTSICGRAAQIWEPNDTKHVAGAINWYKTACRVRTAADLTLNTSYDLAKVTLCGTVADGDAKPTYAIQKEITSGDRVDIYDGLEYNTYTGSSDFLAVYPTFTDTMKDEEGTARPAFMYLAPNSITKVRIYVYIEGQDIDNYDFASIGKSIAVGFGFTKERFEEDSANYPIDGPSLRPVIELTGSEVMSHQVGTPWLEPGYSAKYTASDGVTEYVVPVTVMGTVNVNVKGQYVLTYKTTDTDTLTTYKTRTVTVE